MFGITCTCSEAPTYFRRSRCACASLHVDSMSLSTRVLGLPEFHPRSRLAEAHSCVQIHLHNTRAPATSSVRARTYRCSQTVQRDRVRMCRNLCSALRGVAAHVHTHTCTPICMCSGRQASVPGLIEEHVAQLHPSVHLCCIPRDLRYPRISSQAPGRTNTASKGCRVPACVAHSH